MFEWVQMWVPLPSTSTQVISFICQAGIPVVSPHRIWVRGMLANCYSVIYCHDNPAISGELDDHSCYLVLSDSGKRRPIDRLMERVMTDDNETNHLHFRHLMFPAYTVYRVAICLSQCVYHGLTPCIKFEWYIMHSLQRWSSTVFIYCIIS